MTFVQCRYRKTLGDWVTFFPREKTISDAASKTTTPFKGHLIFVQSADQEQWKPFFGYE